VNLAYLGDPPIFFFNQSGATSKASPGLRRLYPRTWLWLCWYFFWSLAGQEDGGISTGDADRRVALTDPQCAPGRMTDPVSFGAPPPKAPPSV